MGQKLLLIINDQGGLLYSKNSPDGLPIGSPQDLILESKSSITLLINTTDQHYHKIICPPLRFWEKQSWLTQKINAMKPTTHGWIKGTYAQIATADRYSAVTPWLQKIKNEGCSILGIGLLPLELKKISLKGPAIISARILNGIIHCVIDEEGALILTRQIPQTSMPITPEEWASRIFIELQGTISHLRRFESMNVPITVIDTDDVGFHVLDQKPDSMVLNVLSGTIESYLGSRILSGQEISYPLPGSTPRNGALLKGILSLAATVIFLWLSQNIWNQYAYHQSLIITMDELEVPQNPWGSDERLSKLARLHNTFSLSPQPQDSFTQLEAFWPHDHLKIQEIRWEDLAKTIKIHMSVRCLKIFDLNKFTRDIQQALPGVKAGGLDQLCGEGTLDGKGTPAPKTISFELLK